METTSKRSYPKLGNCCKRNFILTFAWESQQLDDQCFLPGPTSIDLYSHRNRLEMLEILDLSRRGVVLSELRKHNRKTCPTLGISIFSYF